MAKEILGPRNGSAFKWNVRKSITKEYSFCRVLGQGKEVGVEKRAGTGKGAGTGQGGWDNVSH